MNRNRLFAATLVVVMVCAAFAPASAAATTSDAGDGALSVSVSQEDGVLVSVDANESIVNDSVENGTVTVAVDDENVTYAGAGSHNISDDGTVELPTPEEQVNATITATVGDTTSEKSATLEPATDDAPSLDVTQDGNDVFVSLTAGDEDVSNTSVTVSTVDENATYTDTGTYTTNENGTVTLTAPLENESVEVAFEATVDGETVNTTQTLEPGEFENFGSLVSTFVEEEKENESDTPLGLRVAGFVVENNPGNAPDHAGPPSHAGPPDDDKKDNQGSPSNASGPSDENTNGGNADDVDSEDNEDDTKKGNGGGPPDHAGPSK